MLINFFMELKKARIPVSITELMHLLEVLKARLVYADIDDFYYLSRMTLVKDERHYDKFDRAFSTYFKGLEDLASLLSSLIPDEEGDDKRGKKRRGNRQWDKRDYKAYDDNIELGTRGLKISLRRLRKLARTGAEDEFDINNTIDKTAKNGGLLDIVMRPERRNTVKVLLFLDNGGSMDAHVRVCEELFSAARSEFKHLETYYFHNFIYDGVWKEHRRRMNERIDTFDILHKYSHDYKVIFVGDATMAPYEITHSGGSVEHWNEEAGAIWMQRLQDTFDKVIWINPTPQDTWEYSTSVALTKKLVEDQMFPLTIRGIEEGMNALSK